jgi:hypothetical protein
VEFRSRPSIKTFGNVGHHRNGRPLDLVT